MIHHIYSPKGGQGCSVTAAMMAIATPGSLLVDMAGDQLGILGLPEPVGWDIGERIYVTGDFQVVNGCENVEPTLSDWDNVIIDHSLWEPPVHSGWLPDRHRLLMVVRNDYLALRHAVKHRKPPDGVILITEPGRALRADDVAAAIGVPVVYQAEIDPLIARAVDAGLLTSRLPRAAQRLGDLTKGQVSA